MTRIKKITKLTNSKISIKTDKKETIKIIYTFDEQNKYLINNIEFNLIIELYTDKMFINAENIVVDGEKYTLP